MIVFSSNRALSLEEKKHSFTDAEAPYTERRKPGFVSATQNLVRIQQFLTTIMAAPVCARLFLQRSAQGLRLNPLAYPAYSSPFLSRAHRLGPSDDEMYQRTTVSVMQKEPGTGPMIHSYSPRGFNIDGNRVVGPCAVVPPAILQWNVGSHTDITVESVALFHMLEPRIEVLILGTGGRTERVDPKVLAFLKSKGIAVEVQDTANACATFNFLTSERRVTAAGLIPIPVSTDVE